MIFLNIKSAHMSDHKAVFQTMFLPQALAFLLPEFKSGHVDRIVQGESGFVPSLTPVIVDPGVPAAAPVICRRSGQELFADQLQRILIIPDDLCVMCVCDPDRNPGVFGTLEGIIAHGLVVRVDDFYFRVVTKQISHEPLVFGEM